MNPSHHRIPTEDDARALARIVVNECSGARVKFGRTNGRIVLHVNDVNRGQSRTIKSYAEWDACPLNDRA